MAHDGGRYPRVLFFNVNGAGTGHLSRCLSYARRLVGQAEPVFFSLASAIHVIHEMGFEADYFVSRFWSRARARAWNRELARRLGMVLERVRPEMVVFDGPAPYPGFLAATRTWGVPRMVWSHRGLYKRFSPGQPVSDRAFDLVIEPGEIGSAYSVQQAASPGRRVHVPPVTVLADDELPSPEAARAALGLEAGRRHVLFSLGSSNLRDVSGIGLGLVREMQARGYTVAWARPPISVKDPPLPEGVIPVDVYPLGRCLPAFDALVSAAGYNTCCEAVQAGIPTLFVPNTQVADDQTRRARMVSRVMPATISDCATDAERGRAVDAVLDLIGREPPAARAELDGAERAATEMMALLERDRR